MSAFLVHLASRGGESPEERRAFEAGASRLRSRRQGEPHAGESGAVRWAAIADASELSVAGDRLGIVDAAPYMIEPSEGPASGAEGLTGVAVDLAAPEAVLRRDRFGAKPLFYMPLGGGWLVASEAKALTPFLSDFRVNPVALSDAINYRWVLGEDFLVEPIRQVLPGAEVRLTPGAAARRGEPALVRFEPDADGAHPSGWHTEQTEAALRAALRRVAAQGDELAIPISGGIDSSVLAALAVDEGLPVRGYIVSYEGHPNPEYQRAKSVAGWLEIAVEELTVTSRDVEDFLADMVWRLEQPPRHLNNVAIRRLYAAIRARTGVVVHGDGAEMMFGLADAHRVRQFAQKRRTVEAVLGGTSRPALERLLNGVPGDVGRRTARLLGSSTSDFARRLDEVGYDRHARSALDRVAPSRTPCPEWSAILPDDRPPSHEELQIFQTYTFLQCCLTRLDRLASPLGLSVSQPFLAGEVVEVARRLPTALKSRAGKGKPVLRDICSRYLPPEVAQWPKLGFQSPDREWILGPATAAARCATERAAEEIDRALPGLAWRDLLRLPDHETRWLVIGLEFALRGLTGRGTAPLGEVAPATGEA